MGGAWDVWERRGRGVQGACPCSHTELGAEAGRVMDKGHGQGSWEVSMERSRKVHGKVHGTWEGSHGSSGRIVEGVSLADETLDETSHSLVDDVARVISCITYCTMVSVKHMHINRCESRTRVPC